jgi:hypothetical protein
VEAVLFKPYHGGELVAAVKKILGAVGGRTTGPARSANG